MKDKDLNFEKALADLEVTVDKLEKGKISLNESLALFEKGVKLARFLRDELNRAEKKIEILLKDEKGALRRAPFDLEGEDESEGDAEKDDEGEGAEGKGGAGKSDAGGATKAAPQGGAAGAGGATKAAPQGGTAGARGATKAAPRQAKKKPEDDDVLPF